MDQHITVSQYIEALRVLTERYSERGELPFEIELFIEDETEILAAFNPEDPLPFS